jgi:hypothetical protein
MKTSIMNKMFIAIIKIYTFMKSIIKIKTRKNKKNLKIIILLNE